MTVNIPHQFRHVLLGLLNRPYMPRELLAGGRPLIVHVSDTPRTSFSFLLRFLRLLEPEYVIHTGDLVDDIKLEDQPGEIGSYERELIKFLRRLEQTSVEKLIIVPGNHDVGEMIERYAERAVTVADGSVVELAGLRLALSHKYQERYCAGDYYLFGHTPFPEHHRAGGTVCLNGIAAITVIEAPTGRLHYLPYPAGTDSVRTSRLAKPGL